MFCCVWVAHFGCMVLCSLRLGCSACFRQFLKVFVNAWNAQFDNDSRVPLVVFSEDFGIQKLFFAVFSNFRVLEGARAPFWTPSAIQGRKKTKKSGKGDPIRDHFGSFGILWATWVLVWLPSGTKERPEGVRVRFSGHRKNNNFTCVSFLLFLLYICYCLCDVYLYICIRYVLLYSLNSFSL